MKAVELDLDTIDWFAIWIESMGNKKYAKVISEFEGIIKMLNNPSTYSLYWPDYCRITRQLDDIRKENVLSVLPEFEPYLL